MASKQTFCAVPPCHAAIKPGHLMCRDHWLQVPMRLRIRVNAAYAVQPGSPEHLDAVSEAILSIWSSHRSEHGPTVL